MEIAAVYEFGHDTRSRLTIASRCAALQVELISVDIEWVADNRKENPRPGCVIADLGTTQELDAIDDLLRHPPVFPIVLTTHSIGIAGVVSWMRRGAAWVIEQPLSYEQLDQALQETIEESRQSIMLWERWQALQAREQTLSDRERRILSQIAAGALNKEVARQLNLSVRTIETHRSELLRKYQAKTAAHVAAQATELRLLDQLMFQSRRA